MHALILADGEPAERAGLDAMWPGWDKDVALVVAADGGARLAVPLGVAPDLWVGDADSISPSELDELIASGVSIERSPTDKDESDGELAIRAALGRGATRITVVGALGGPRLDHTLANVALLWLDEVAGLDVRLLSATARVRALRAPMQDESTAIATLDGRVGDRVSILTWGAAAVGVRTTGLHYPLDDEDLSIGRPRGLSNLRTTTTATVEMRGGSVVIIESPASL
jgi:thiamine pyrophosphokinase